jgi:hypothetical protein
MTGRLVDRSILGGRRRTLLQKPYRIERGILKQREYGPRRMSSFAIDLSLTNGFLVADRRGRLVGRVESPMYGTAPDEPDALAVRCGIFSRRRIVPAAAIEEIDGASGVIELRVERDSIRTFL